MDKRKFLVPFFKKGLVLFFVNISLFASNNTFSSVRVWYPSSEIISTIQQAGVALDHSTSRSDVYIDFVASNYEKKILSKIGIPFEILIDDLSAFYKKRSIPAMSRNFPLGSMQGNYTWDELNQRFDELKSLYPEIISDKVVLGQSIEGNDIWTFKLSDNANIDEEEPEILYTGLTHSREPLSMMNLFYFVQNLCEGYQSSSSLEANYLINEREMWFIPVINPDGYIYNEQIEPNGGGMHRKNRKDTGCGQGTQRGVDLNRNFSFGWGINDTGSSPDPCYATYRGASGFSEPETQVVRDFINTREFVNVLHYHSYGNMYIHPFGDGSYPDSLNLLTFRGLANEMSDYNNFIFGTGYETVGYTVNGDAVDWSYGVNNIIAYTPEVGLASQGFWPSADEVESICIDQFEPNKVFAFVAGSDFILDEFSLSNEFQAGINNELLLNIKNRGLVNSSGPVVVSIESLTSLIVIDDSLKEISSLSSWGNQTLSFDCSVQDQIPYFSEVSIRLIVHDSESYQYEDTINFFIGTPITIYEENFDSGLGEWVVDGEWGLTDEPAIGSYALTDSPNGDYGAELTSVARLNVDLNLDFIANPYVSFSAQWDIEDGYDFIRFQAYLEETGWISMQGAYTITGNGASAQPMGEFGYDGIQSNWVEDKFYLDQLGGLKPSAFRFIQNSDQFVEGDGFVVDAFSINGYSIGKQGDYFPDGDINIFDIVGLADLISYGREPSEYALNFCDIDSNGEINIYDLLTIINLVSNQ